MEQHHHQAVPFLVSPFFFPALRRGFVSTTRFFFFLSSN